MRRQVPPSDGDEPQHFRRVEIVERQQQVFGVGIGGGQLRLDDRNRAGRLAALRGVDQHRRLVAVEQRIGQIDPANAEIGDRDR